MAGAVVSVFADFHEDGFFPHDVRDIFFEPRNAPEVVVAAKAEVDGRQQGGEPNSCVNSNVGRGVRGCAYYPVTIRKSNFKVFSKSKSKSTQYPEKHSGDKCTTLEMNPYSSAVGSTGRDDPPVGLSGSTSEPETKYSP